jgi:hypothetical protein
MMSEVGVPGPQVQELVRSMWAMQITVEHLPSGKCNVSIGGKLIEILGFDGKPLAQPMQTEMTYGDLVVAVGEALKLLGNVQQRNEAVAMSTPQVLQA